MITSFEAGMHLSFAFRKKEGYLFNLKLSMLTIVPELAAYALYNTIYGV